MTQRWTLNLPSLGQSLAAFIQDYRLQHNHVLRLLEPLGAPEDTFAAADITNELPALEQDSLAAPNPGDTGQLDEPFRGLDRTKRRALLSQARQLWSGATLIYITHDVNQTETFDRALVIEGGNIVEDAAPGILANNPGWAASDQRGGYQQAGNGDNLESIAGVKTRVPGLVDPVSLMLSFIFLWIVFGQVGLIALSWGAAKGPDETNEVDDASGAGDEEE